MNALIEKFPGQRISVPGSIPARIAAFVENYAPLIGAIAVAALLEEFGRDRIIVPSRKTHERHLNLRRVKMEEVAELSRQDMTAAQIAHLLRCNPWTVHKHRTRAKALGLLRPKRKRKARR